ncbi:transposable element Tc1 transposase [Trichonephila clavipes]|nr:transposable element Tc1 transposase [Trichonephila clavipes]
MMQLINNYAQDQGKPPTEESRQERSGQYDKARETRTTTSGTNRAAERRPVRSKQATAVRPCPYYLRRRVKQPKGIPEEHWNRQYPAEQHQEKEPRNGSLRRKNKTALEPKNVLPTLKYGGGNVIVWGCVAHNGAGNFAFFHNKMNALAYIDVLRHNLLDSAKKLSMKNTFILQQDKDPNHTTIVTKTWLL